jgi:hypothetical protein
LRSRRKNRSQLAQMMPEFTASLIMIVPLIIISIYVMIEASEAYVIHCTLKQAASTAARKLAMSYGMDPKYTVARAGVRLFLQLIILAWLIATSSLSLLERVSMKHLTRQR